tara:strand:- start:3173 stop:3409 length:237 start_codon:yes stop_codon:yes gene_type:complete
MKVSKNITIPNYKMDNNKEIALEVCKCWVGEMIVDRIRKCLEDKEDPMRLEYIDILSKLQLQIQKIKIHNLEHRSASP